MSTDGKKLGIAVMCVDWRLHQKDVRFAERIRDALGVDVVDVVSVPGPDGMAHEGKEAERGALLSWLNLLIGAHHPTSIALVGHYTCAANPVDESAHDTDAREAAEYFKEASGFKDIRAFSAVRKTDSEWELKEV
ncbi:MAG TPA: carbonic anhydrase [Candidatus Paceibacterota bacterium]|nr:carbonic anhydrase [Candidatus Paceibacterota bacterium]